MFQYVNVIKVFHNTHTIKGVKYFALLTPFCLITPSLEASKDYDSLKVNEKLHFRYKLFFVCYFSILVAFVLKQELLRCCKPT